MKRVLINEIKNERPNKSSLGAFNRALRSGKSRSQAVNAAKNVNRPAPAKSSASKFGVQKDGTFIAPNMKVFGRQVEKMATQKNPGSVSLRRKDGTISIKVEKNGTLYRVTNQYSKSDIRRHSYSQSEFERNYRHYLG